MGIRDKPIAPGSPWQNGFAEKLIGSIRRECLDHLVIMREAHLRQILQNYADYYNKVRTHRSLGKEAPRFRPVQRFGNYTLFSAGFITIMFGFRFSVRTIRISTEMACPHGSTRVQAPAMLPLSARWPSRRFRRHSLRWRDHHQYVPIPFAVGTTPLPFWRRH
jgi:hypothetical protein